MTITHILQRLYNKESQANNYGVETGCVRSFGLFTRLANATIVIETTPILINFRYITPDTQGIDTGLECWLLLACQEAALHRTQVRFVNVQLCLCPLPRSAYPSVFL